jgi:Nucleoside-diphosphate-sugar epimerases
MSPSVLVTGGAGFIGSHLVDAYVAAGWQVSVIDDLSSGKLENLNPAATLYEMDIRNDEVVELVKELRPEVISHHAAQMDVRKSVADPTADAVTNVVGSVRLLQAAADAKVRRFVFASTGGAIYGEPLFVPQDELHPANPLSPYGCAKRSVEHYLNYFRLVQGLSTVALRYANVYGPRQNPHGEAGVVAIFAEKLRRGEAVTINGVGEQTRDFVHVDDVVRANLAASAATWDGCYNVGTGVETSVNQLYALMAEILGIERKPMHAEAKPGEQMRSVLDGSRLRQLASLPAPRTLRDGMPSAIGSERIR